MPGGEEFIKEKRKTASLSGKKDRMLFFSKRHTNRKRKESK
jgi:hypothetical protein